MSTSARLSALVANRPPKPDPITTTRCRGDSRLWAFVMVFSPETSAVTGTPYPFSTITFLNTFGVRRLAAPRHGVPHTWKGAEPAPLLQDGQVSTHFDLAVIGTGSGNSIIDDRFADRSVALIEQGTFGGTCVNVGCIPTKMYVYPADVARAAAHGPELGVDTRLDGVRWPAIRDRIFGRIDPMSRSGREWRLKNDNVTLFEEHARFVGERTLDVGPRGTITADQVVLAAGSRPVIPDIEGLPRVGFHTSDTIMRLPELPRRLLIIGGGYIAAEFAHVFGAFGAEVTVVNRSPRLLMSQDDEISERFTQLAMHQWDVGLNDTVSRVKRYDV